MSANQTLETWEIHNRINLYVLEAIAPASLSDVSPAKGRNVGELFAHLHNVRLMWLKAAAPELLKACKEMHLALESWIERRDPTIEELAQLRDSCLAAVATRG